MGTGVGQGSLLGLFGPTGKVSAVEFDVEVRPDLLHLLGDVHQGSDPLGEFVEVVEEFVDVRPVVTARLFGLGHGIVQPVEDGQVGQVVNSLHPFDVDVSLFTYQVGSLMTLSVHSLCHLNENGIF